MPRTAELFKTRIRVGPDDPIFRLIKGAPRLSVFVQGILIRYWNEVGPGLPGEEVMPVQLYIKPEDAPELVRYLKALPRGGISDMIRAALYYEIGRQATMEWDKITDILADKLTDRILEHVQLEQAAIEKAVRPGMDLDPGVLESLGTWEVNDAGH